ncbi:MAG: hypothetical protein WAS27_01525 [Candidatus Saccharimonadales bacterium]
MSPGAFQQLLTEQGHSLYRPMPWRDDTRPYYVLVSELMLQQTQAPRVIPKFNAFIAAFPDEQALAAASLAEVLVMWQGLGYNRRAKFLHDAAQHIVRRGSFPREQQALLALPGVGRNTAGAVRAYAFNQPALFVETNIRTVYLHHFFDDSDAVDDRQILAMLEQTIDHEQPRSFYWALMDYGTFLKRQGVGTIRRSKHYKKQSALKGSVREIRGRIIAQLVHGGVTRTALEQAVSYDERFDTALAGLERDGLIRVGDTIYLTK